MSSPRLLQEFKAFAFKGNMIDLAIAVVIGNGFLAVVNSLVKNIIMPTVSYVLPAESHGSWRLGRVDVGAFAGESFNFLLVALAVFLLIVKAREFLRNRGMLPPAAEPTTKPCPMCFSNIPLQARRCPHCTSMLE